MKSCLERAKQSKEMIGMEDQVAFLESLYCISKLIGDVTEIQQKSSQEINKQLIEGAKKGKRHLITRRQLFFILLFSARFLRRASRPAQPGGRC